MEPRRSIAQRGSVGVYLLFSIVVAGAAGYGVYRFMHARAQAAPAADESPPPPPRVARPEPPRPVAPVEEPAPPPLPPPDEDDLGAVAPNDVASPEKDTVLLGTPGVTAGVDAGKVERMVRRYSGRYERCMRHAHEHTALHAGELRITIAIAPDGSVTDATYRASVSDELATCVVEVIKKLRFDKPRGGAPAKAVYPMRFVPGTSEVSATDPLGDMRSSPR